MGKLFVPWSVNDKKVAYADCRSYLVLVDCSTCLFDNGIDQVSLSAHHSTANKSQVQDGNTFPVTPWESNIAMEYPPFVHCISFFEHAGDFHCYVSFLGVDTTFFQNNLMQVICTPIVLVL